MKLVTREEYLMGRDKEYPISFEQSANLDKLLVAIHAFQRSSGLVLSVRSGYRPAAINARIAGAAPRSKHIECLAIDVADPSGAIAFYCLNNLDVLERCGLWMEHPDHTDKGDESWCHLQCVAPGSGKRVFKP